MSTSTRVAIVGHPNSGKSQIFSNLTGKYTLIANYPFSTINIKKASFSTPEGDYEIYDTPGIYSLFIQSEEGLAVRDLLFSGKIDIILLCIDANQLKQSLLLMAELIDMGTPMVAVVNAIDESTRKGIWIDTERLSRILGIPVVESIAVKGAGTNRLKNALQRARVPKATVRFGDLIESAISTIEAMLPDSLRHKRKTSFLMLLKDKYLKNILKEVDTSVVEQIAIKADDLTNSFKANPVSLISYTYSQWVDDVYAQIVKRHSVSATTMSETAARLCRAPISGILILLSILAITYFAVVNIANEVADFLETLLWSPVDTWLKAVIQEGFWQDLLIGDYGVLSLGVVGALLTVLPILSVFFLIYSILEDVGYIPNLSILSRRIFGRLGMSGFSILPVVLGFGCKTMATLSTKTIPSKKERYIAIFLIAFAVPCAPQIGLSMSLLGKLGVLAFAISTAILITVEVITGLILNKLIAEDRREAFIQMLPPIRFPNLRNVMTKTSRRLHEFLVEAFPVFIVASIGLFTLDKTGALDALKVFLAPITTGFLSLPSDMVDALILVVARREAAVVIISGLTETGRLDFVQGIVAITLATMFFPCAANLGAIIKQLGLRHAIFMAVVITISSVLIAGLANYLLRLVF